MRKARKKRWRSYALEEEKNYGNLGRVESLCFRFEVNPASAIHPYVELGQTVSNRCAHKVWVIDPCYDNALGHNATYMKFIAQMLPTIYFHCFAFGNKIPEIVLPNLKVEPLFPGNYWITPIQLLKSEGYYLDGGIAYALSQLSPSDHLLIPTLDLEIAHALARAFELRRGETRPFVHAVIHHVDNRIMAPKEAAVPAYARLDRACNGAEGIAYYAPFSGLVSPIRQVYGVHADKALHVFPGAETYPLSALKLSEPGRRFSVGFFGNARADKGLHLVPSLIDYMKSSFPSHLHRIDFLVQSFAADARMIEIAAQMKQLLDGCDASLRVDYGQKSDDEYLKSIESVDIIALPYMRSAFRGRGSGIAVDATLLGKPFVYTSELIFGHHAPNASLPAANLGEFARNLAALMDDYDRYARAARIAREEIILEAQQSVLFDRLARPADDQRLSKMPNTKHDSATIAANELA